MRQKPFFIIFEGLSLKQIKTNLFKDESRAWPKKKQEQKLQMFSNVCSINFEYNLFKLGKY